MVLYPARVPSMSLLPVSTPPYLCRFSVIFCICAQKKRKCRVLPCRYWRVLFLVIWYVVVQGFFFSHVRDNSKVGERQGHYDSAVADTHEQSITPAKSHICNSMTACNSVTTDRITLYLSTYGSITTGTVHTTV